ncbi:MAG TPA: ribose 5-phosphate isomerase B [Thermoanaerobaculia bacterium]|jgi:ribose 5-phosphate isomerase B|nr:ribose 5-phosphate isomerase B [Thermoanaerobaculia bacterium]
MKIAVSCDHAGFPLKRGVIECLRGLGHSVEDLGTDSTDPVDYPDFARAVAASIASRRSDRGVVICGSGVGASVAATKVPGIRAAMCHDTFSARQGVEDDDMNVLCLGARVIGPALATELVRAFVNARFSGADRHVRRLGKVNAIEEDARNGVFDDARRVT